MERVEPDLLLGALLEVADRLPKMKPARLEELRQRGAARLKRAPRAEPPVAVKKVISVRSQARGLANDWPIDRKPGLRCQGPNHPRAEWSAKHPRDRAQDWRPRDKNSPSNRFEAQNWHRSVPPLVRRRPRPVAELAGAAVSDPPSSRSSESYSIRPKACGREALLLPVISGQARSRLSHQCGSISTPLG